MKTKLLVLVAALIAVFPTFGQDDSAKKIAVLQTVDTEQAFGRGEMLMVGNRIANVLRNIAGYRVYDRVDISAIIDEQNFQRTGLVSDDQIKKIGEMAGVDLVLFTEISKISDGKIYIYGKVMDVETAEWKLFGDTTADSIGEIEEALRTMIRRMLNADNGQSGNAPNGNNTFNGNGAGRDFVETAAGLNMKMVWVEGGEFMMGATSEQGSDAYNNEKPVRRVKLDSYYIGECEVTQAQWEKVMGTSIHQQANKVGYSTSSVGPDYPIYYVSWEEAQAFCSELSRMTGRTYCLPTEAQWEYAARGGKKADGTKYSGSWSVDAVAWYQKNPFSNCNYKVKNKRANGLGLYDMSGNVREWCSDWYGDYNVNDTNNPTGPSSGSYRVLRGGCMLASARNCRISFRCFSRPGGCAIHDGFRVALIP